MKGILTRMMPVMAHPIPADEEEYTGEYSFAAEYQGPPVTYELPRAVPVDIKRIPTASMVAIASYSGKFALPVVQPLNLKTECSKELVCEKNCGGGGEGSDCRVLSEISSSSTLGFSNSCDRSCELSDVIDSSGVLGSSNGLECSRELSSRLSSSDMLGIDDRSGVLGIDDRSGGLGFSNGIECSNELSSRISSSDTLGMINGEDESGEIGRLDVLEFSQGSTESGEYVNGRSHRDWGSSESVLSSHLLNSEADDFGNASQRLAKRAAVVTFRDVKSGDVIDEESSQVESDTVLERKEATAKGKKGACYRCFKGNRFTEKEVCIVCTAKYCGNCVLRAMGSMPEGRKCVTCIGYPIDESKRGSLGKCSRVLKRLLSELEVQQIMKAEKFCEANQLQPELVYVNGNQLSQEELDVLQSCPNPPLKLKPGCYWYDKVAGFWGKEGQKPCKIISPHLSVGGPIMPNASNGNTGVFINNREITKVELRMLQLAGVQCAGNPHFWVNEDGSYQEEGQKNIKGNLWSKAGTKLACALLSLPIPSKAAHPSGEEVYDLGGRALPDYIEKRTIQKLLLVGYKGCGTSTMFKQAKILYKADPFLDDELEDIKLVIQSNVYRYLGILLEGRERFEDESLTDMGKKQLLDQSGTVGEGDGKTIYSVSPKLKTFSDWLLKVMVSGNLEAIFPAATREYAPLVEELWRDDAIQATFNRRSELQLLPGNASYFLERVVDISRVDYEPSNTDILYAEGITSSNGLSCLDFSFPQSTVDGVIDPAEHESLLRYQLIRVHARGLGENCKWLEMFEDVRIVIFCVALSDYDEFCDDGSGATTNKMLESRRLFENIITHPIFEHMDFHLILNKFDLFEKKIERIPLNRCEWFEDFNPVTSRQNTKKIMNNASSAQLAFHYIGVKFKRHFSSLTGRKLYVSSVNGLEPCTVDEALRYSREILKWDEERAYFSASEYSIYSTEASFSP